MKTKSLRILVLMTAFALFATPVLAAPGNGPKYLKHVASLEYESTRFGQVTYNTNPEDDDSYELEVEIEEGSKTDVTVTVYLDGVPIGTIDLDENGNGKDTFYVDGPLDVIDKGSIITIDDTDPLESGFWRLWVKGSSPK